MVYTLLYEIMEWNKKNSEAAIALMKRLQEVKTINETEGRELTGAYWESIAQEINSRCAANLSRGGVGMDGKRFDGRIQILFPHQLDPIIAECQDRLDAIEKEVYDRELDNKSKLAVIKANRIAKCAIVISVLAATGLPQYLLQWLYKMFLELVCLLSN